jgi:negative regulator of flagellin synthesis FlgM
MDIRSGFEGLKSILGVSQPAPAPTQPKSNSAIGGSGLGNDQATFSNAASAVSMGSADSGVRIDKVAQIQAALAAGSYSISTSALASRMVDSMLGSAQ